MSKNSKFTMKGKMSSKKEQSAYLAPRGVPLMGKKSYTGGEPSAFLAARGEPAKGKTTFKDSRYK